MPYTRAADATPQNAVDVYHGRTRERPGLWPGRSESWDTSDLVVVVGRVSERTFVLFFLFRGLFVVFLEDVALIFFLFLDRAGNRDLVVDDFIDHDSPSSVIVARRPPSGEVG